ncbi:hypothetical protein [Pseudoalteromonas sp. McH1-42]|uniref:hypothetical protein n=1 Tax=Pseudoalteromonas sp. McH1-42 TaxID=2917752 RepID=UPI001EF5F137|nr:hypothetical protein [Pseudoalteromonas sp. McH1-42]MCG7561269.1 hypothetical protein [Pseudoalteromonas sp. McH1-42]
MRFLFLIFLLFSSGQLFAKTTWIPIYMDKITTFIPYIPSYKYPEPSSVAIETIGDVKYMKWEHVIHASKYLVQGKDANGNWIDVLITEDNSVTIDARFDKYYQLRVVACNFNTCSDTGLFSQGYSHRESVIFIHTDMLGTPVLETDVNGKLF